MFSPSVDVFHSVVMSSRLTKKSFVSVPGRSVSTPSWDLPDWRSAPAARRPGRSSPARSASACTPGRPAVSPATASRRPAGSCGTRRPAGSSTANDSASVCSAEASVRPGRTAPRSPWPAFRAACSTAADPPRTIRSAREILVPPVWAALKSAWICSSFARTPASSSGSLTSQSFCGASRIRAPFAPPRLSVPRKLAAAAQAVATSWAIDRPDSRSLLLEGRDVGVGDQVVVDRRDGILPRLRLRHPRAEVPADRPHVAVQQLVPGLGERLGELIGVLVEAPGDRPVDRVDLQGQVGGEHHRRVPPVRVVGVGHRCPSRQRPSASTAAHRRGWWSAPTRNRTGCPGSRCPSGWAVVHAPSSPLVSVSAPLPVPYMFFHPKPCCSIGRPRARARCSADRRPRGTCRPCGRRRSERRSPRRSSPSGAKVSRMSRAEASGSGLPLGPSGLT